MSSCARNDQSCAGCSDGVAGGGVLAGAEAVAVEGAFMGSEVAGIGAAAGDDGVVVWPGARNDQSCSGCFDGAAIGGVGFRATGGCGAGVLSRRGSRYLVTISGSVATYAPPLISKKNRTHRRGRRCDWFGGFWGDGDPIVDGGSSHASVNSRSGSG